MRRPRSTVPVVIAAVVLTLGVGAGSYAAGAITGGDIKNGTVTSADIKNDNLTSGDVKNGTLQLRDLGSAAVDDLRQGPRVIVSSKGAGSYLPDVPADTTFHSMTVPKGTWLVSVTATVFRHDGLSTPDALCNLRTADESGLLARVSFTPDDGYVSLASQMVVHASGQTSVGLVCNGNNFGVNQVTLTAVEAGRVTGDTP